MYNERSCGCASFDSVFIVVKGSVDPNTLTGFFDFEGPYPYGDDGSVTYIGKLYRQNKASLEARDDVLGVYPDSQMSSFGPQGEKGGNCPNCSCNPCSCDPCDC